MKYKTGLTEQTNLCPKSTTETLKQGVNYVQGQQ